MQYTLKCKKIRNHDIKNLFTITLCFMVWKIEKFNPALIFETTHSEYHLLWPFCFFGGHFVWWPFSWSAKVAVSEGMKRASWKAPSNWNKGLFLQLLQKDLFSQRDTIYHESTLQRSLSYWTCLAIFFILNLSRIVLFLWTWSRQIDLQGQVFDLEFTWIGQNYIYHQIVV